MKQARFPTDRYWAAESREQIGALVVARFERYWREVDGRGLVDMWRKNARAYYGQDPTGDYANSAVVTFGGEQGELALLHSPDYRQLVKSMHTLATAQRPGIEVTATSDDPEALSQTITARQILDYDLDEGAGGLEEAFLHTHERALVFAEGYLVDEWDPMRGEELGVEEVPEVAEEDGEIRPPTLRVVRSGEPRARYKSPTDVARDLDAERVSDHRWYVIRDRVHRWEMIADYPEAAATIAAAPNARDSEYQLWRRSEASGEGPSDYVEAFTLYHLPTTALPNGRYVRTIEGAVLEDHDLASPHLPVHADIPSEEMDEAVGYGDSWDLIALQQALNSVEGAMLTVHDAGSVPNWISKRGQSVDVRMLEGSLRLVEYDDDGTGGAPPGPMDMPSIQEMSFKLAEHYTQKMQVASGINSVVRGDPDANVKSGAYAALVASMAVQANSAQQRAYARLMRSVLNGRLKLYQLNATEPRLIEIVGSASVGHVRSFTHDDLDAVRRVRVELASPVLRTVQGKTEHAKLMLEMYGPVVITPDRFMALQQTGRMDSIYNAEATHEVNAKRENSAMRRGEPAPVLVCDHHAIHIREHLREIDDPAVRMDPAKEALRAAILGHVQQHAEMWAGAPPELLSATGQEPAPGGPPPGPPGAPQGPAAAPVDAGPPVEAVAPGAGGVVPGEAPPGMPSLPTNPATGQPAIMPAMS